MSDLPPQMPLFAYLIVLPMHDFDFQSSLPHGTNRVARVEDLAVGVIG